MTFKKLLTKIQELPEALLETEVFVYHDHDGPKGTSHEGPGFHVEDFSWDEDKPVLKGTENGCGQCEKEAFEVWKDEVIRLLTLKGQKLLLALGLNFELEFERCQHLTASLYVDRLLEGEQNETD